MILRESIKWLNYKNSPHRLMLTLHDIVILTVREGSALLPIERHLPTLLIYYNEQEDKLGVYHS